MRLNEVFDKDLQKKTTEYYSEHFISHPQFMYLCPNKDKRKKYIIDYFNYYMPRLAKDDMAFISKSGRFLITMVSKKYLYRPFYGSPSSFSIGDSARRMKFHSSVCSDIFETIIPIETNAVMFNFFGDFSDGAKEMVDMIEEIQQYSKDNNVVIVYETFSRRLIPVFEKMGFATAFQCGFGNTQYVQTLMTYGF